MMYEKGILEGRMVKMKDKKEERKAKMLERRKDFKKEDENIYIIA